MRLKIVLLASVATLIVSGRAPSLASEIDEPPTLKVKSTSRIVESNGLDVYDYAPEYELATISWKATHATTVLVMGYDVEDHPVEGEIFFEHVGVFRDRRSYLVVAIGPGGSASVAIGSNSDSHRGTGLNGLIYGFNDTFNPEVFFKLAIKERVEVDHVVSQQVVQDIVFRDLQRRGVNVALTQCKSITDGLLVYTPTFLEHPSLAQSAEEEKKQGKIRRQIAIVLHVVVKSQETTTSVEFEVLPIVRRNFPRDNKKWLDDPDPRLGNPIAKQWTADWMAELVPEKKK